VDGILLHVRCELSPAAVSDTAIFGMGVCIYYIVLSCCHGTSKYHRRRIKFTVRSVQAGLGTGIVSDSWTMGVMYVSRAVLSLLSPCRPFLNLYGECRRGTVSIHIL